MDSPKDFLSDDKNVQILDDLCAQNLRLPVEIDNHNGTQPQGVPVFSGNIADFLVNQSVQAPSLFELFDFQRNNGTLDVSRARLESELVDTGEISQEFRHPHAPQFTPNPRTTSEDPVCGYRTNEWNAEEVLQEPCGSEGLVRGVNDGLGNQLDRNLRTVGSVGYQQPVESYPNEGTSANEATAGDSISTNAVPAVTVENEEHGRHVECDFDQLPCPEIPDIFLNSQNYINGLARASHGQMIDLLCGHQIPNTVWDIQSTPRTTNPGVSLEQVLRETSHTGVDGSDMALDALRSRRLSFDIVSELGSMPVGALHAFMDGDNAFRGMADENSGYVSGFGTDQMDVRYFSTSNHRNDDLEEYSDALENSCFESLERDGVSPSTNSEANRNELPSSFSLQDCNRTRIGESSGGPYEAGLTQSPVAGMSIDREERRVTRRNRQNRTARLGVFPSIASEENECNIHVLTGSTDGPITGILAVQSALCDVTNREIGSQKLETGNACSGIDQGTKSQELKEIWKQLRALSKKVEKKRQSRGQELINLKYYSLKRMEKDLRENLVFSEHIYQAALRLREERAELDKACERERMEVQRLRNLLQA